MIITRTSTLSGKTRSRDLPITHEQYMAWRGGEYIQDAMPQLSDSDREFIISGITDEEWDAAFPEE
jgi:hypothetical protein